MRIPKKKELLELQKKYRTDKKIGEVYGVPARLVAYWRGKKKIGPYSYPKYSEEKILELWERFGDDAKAGEELGISRAGFRQWRRKYHIDRRPVQLRLEQLELPLPESNRKKSSRRETIIQKLLARKSGLKKVEIGEVVNAEPDLVMSHNNTGQIISQFRQIGIEKVWNPSKIAVVIDHWSASEPGRKALAHKAIREFVKKQKIKSFYDVGEGICHQVIVENGHVLPGQLALGADSHVSAYGSLGAVSCGIGVTETAAIWATGRLWLKVPETLRVVINGKLARGIYAKDVMLKLVTDLTSHVVNYRAIEFYGATVASMSVSERFTLTILATEKGVKSAVVPFDEITMRYLKKATKTKLTPVIADADADYCDEIELDVTYLTPQVASQGNGDNVRPVEEMVGKRVDQIVLGSCANGRIDDLEIAARILRGRRVNRDVVMLIVPGSRKVLSEALERGFIKTFIDSGCVILNPGCGPCLGAHQEAAESGERTLSTTNCNCRGEIASSGSEIYVTSPATAAATALDGAIADPRKYAK